MIHRPLALLITMLLPGCFAVGPDYEPPKMPVPQQWSETTATGSHAEHDNDTQAEQWWKSFNDPLLDNLINDAIASNLDFKLALELNQWGQCLRYPKK